MNPPDFMVRRPARVAPATALRAFAHGAAPHLGPRGELPPPHELAHVVQQREGRVTPGNLLANVPINDVER
jgi:hypothetical protein